MTIKQRIEEFKTSNKMITATITRECISGAGHFAGYMVELQDSKLKKLKHVFLPRSESSAMTFSVSDVEEFGVEFKDYNEEKNSLVVSARTWMKQYVEHKRFAFLNELQEDAKFELPIAQICDFGLFVDMGLVQGLIHKSNLPQGKSLDDYNLDQTIYVSVDYKNILKQQVRLSFADESQRSKHFHVETAGAHDLKAYLETLNPGNVDTKNLISHLSKRSDWTVKEVLDGAYDWWTVFKTL